MSIVQQTGPQLITQVGDVVEIDATEAGSVSVVVLGTPTPNLTLTFEALSGDTWTAVQCWDPTSATPSMASTLAATTTATRVCNVGGFGRFRVRCTAFTSQALVVLTSDESVLCVPPMLGAGQRVLAVDQGGAFFVGSPYRVISAASDNAAVISNTTRYVYRYNLINTGAAVAYVKLYNKATAPSSADTPQETIAIKAGDSYTWQASILPLRFQTGIGIRMVTGAADADNTAVAAGQIIAQIWYN